MARLKNQEKREKGENCKKGKDGKKVKKKVKKCMKSAMKPVESKQKGKKDKQHVEAPRGKKHVEVQECDNKGGKLAKDENGAGGHKGPKAVGRTQDPAINDSTPDEVDKILEPVRKNSTLVCGDGDCPGPSEVSLRKWTERQKLMFQLKHRGEVVIGITASHFGEHRAGQLMGLFKDMYIKGFTKQQLVDLKEDIRMNVKAHNAQQRLERND